MKRIRIHRVEAPSAKSAKQELYQMKDRLSAKNVHQAPDTIQVIFVHDARMVVTVLLLDSAHHAKPVNSVTTIKVLVDRAEEDINARKERIKQQKLNARKILTQKRDQVNARIVQEAKQKTTLATESKAHICHLMVQLRAVRVLSSVLDIDIDNSAIG